MYISYFLISSNEYNAPQLPLCNSFWDEVQGMSGFSSPNTGQNAITLLLYQNTVEHVDCCLINGSQGFSGISENARIKRSQYFLGVRDGGVPFDLRVKFDNDIN
jgi:hypothetical protein